MEVETQIKPRVVRRYSEQERAGAVALYDQTGNLEKTSQTLGIPLSTLAGWVNSGDYDSELRNQKAVVLAEKFENAAHLYLDLAVKKSKKAPFNHLMTGAAIAIDKSQLLKGLPTSITASNQAIEGLKDKLAEAIQLAREQRKVLNANDLEVKDSE